MSLFHIPLNMDRKMTRDLELIQRAHALPPRQLILLDESSSWGADIYIDIARKVPGAELTTLSGTFLIKVFE